VTDKLNSHWCLVTVYRKIWLWKNGSSEIQVGFFRLSLFIFGAEAADFSLSLLLSCVLPLFKLLIFWKTPPKRWSPDSTTSGRGRNCPPDELSTRLSSSSSPESSLDTATASGYHYYPHQSKISNIIKAMIST
jgi:hypothetical protein